MLKAWKSYWAFTNGIYKVFMLLVLPILLILTEVVLLLTDVGSGIELFLMLFFIDTISDYFFMGGFYKKNSTSFEFLQTTNRFSKFAKEVVCVDAVRRVLLYQVPYCIILLWTIGNTEDMEWWMTMAFLPWLLTLGAQLVTLVSRHFTTWNYVYVCTAIGFLVLCPIMMVALIAVNIHWSFNLMLIIAVFLASWGTCLYTGKKVKESYYDK